MERMQSEWENLVKFNLSESGVAPLTLRDLLPDSDTLNEFIDMKLGYSQTNGTIPLRKLISSHYTGTNEDNVLVTNGGAEANFLAAWRFLNESTKGKHLVMMLPNYMQLDGVWKTLGGTVDHFKLIMEQEEPLH